MMEADMEIMSTSIVVYILERCAFMVRHDGHEEVYSAWRHAYANTRCAKSII